MMDCHLNFLADESLLLSQVIYSVEDLIFKLIAIQKLGEIVMDVIRDSLKQRCVSCDSVLECKHIFLEWNGLNGLSEEQYGV